MPCTRRLSEVLVLKAVRSSVSYRTQQYRTEADGSICRGSQVPVTDLPEDPTTAARSAMSARTRWTPSGVSSVYSQCSIECRSAGTLTTHASVRLLVVSWLRFFLQGVQIQVDEAHRRADVLIDLHEDTRSRYQNERSEKILRVMMRLFENPYLYVNTTADWLGVQYSTANRLVGHFEEGDVLMRLTGQGRNRFCQTYKNFNNMGGDWAYNVRRIPVCISD